MQWMQTSRYIDYLASQQCYPIINVIIRLSVNVSAYGQVRRIEQGHGSIVQTSGAGVSFYLKFILCYVIERSVMNLNQNNQQICLAFAGKKLKSCLILWRTSFNCNCCL